MQNAAAVRTGARAAERIVIDEARSSLSRGERLTIITASGDRARHLRSSLRRSGIPAAGHTDQHEDPAAIRVISIRWAAGMRKPEGTIIIDLNDSRKPANRTQAVQTYGQEAKHILGRDGSEKAAETRTAETRAESRHRDQAKSRPGEAELARARGQGTPTLRRTVRILYLP